MKGKKNSPMEPMLRQGTHIYIPFADGCALLNTRGGVRMYKNPGAFARHNPELAKTAELVEYAPVTGGARAWMTSSSPSWATMRRRSG